jgi:hypothetical protein
MLSGRAATRISVTIGLADHAHEHDDADCHLACSQIDAVMGLAPASKDSVNFNGLASASHERPFIGGHTFSCTLLLMIIGSAPAP